MQGLHRGSIECLPLPASLYTTATGHGWGWEPGGPGLQHPPTPKPPPSGEGGPQTLSQLPCSPTCRRQRAYCPPLTADGDLEALASSVEMAPPLPAQQPLTARWPAFLASDWAPSLPIRAPPLIWNFCSSQSPSSAACFIHSPGASGLFIGQNPTLTGTARGLPSPPQKTLLPTPFQGPPQTVTSSRTKSKCCCFCSTPPRRRTGRRGTSKCLGFITSSLDHPPIPSLKLSTPNLGPHTHPPQAHSSGSRGLGYSKLHDVAEAKSLAPGPGACPRREELALWTGTTRGLQPTPLPHSGSSDRQTREESLEAGTGVRGGRGPWAADLGV